MIQKDNVLILNAPVMLTQQQQQMPARRHMLCSERLDNHNPVKRVNKKNLISIL